MIQSVAVIGVGHMGGPMAHRIHDAGFRLLACDLDEDLLAPFAEIGAATTKDARDCAVCELVIVLVADSEQVAAVSSGPHGLAGGVSEGRRPILCVMSTVTSRVIEQLHDELSPLGIRVVDAPVSGGLVKAQEGTLTIMLGGDDDDVKAVSPVMRAMGTQLFECGPRGSGETVKIINNMIGITILYLGAEAFSLALERGIDFDRLMPILEESTGRNFFTENAADAPKAYAAWAQTPQDFQSILSIVRKDIDLARILAGESNGSFPMLGALSETLAELGDETYERWRAIGASQG